MMRRILAWSIAAAIVVSAGIVILASAQVPGLREVARRRTELYLKERFKSTVQISDFHVESIYPRVHVTAAGIVLRHEGRTDVPPLIQIKQVAFDAEPLSLVSRRPVVKAVHVDGMEIQIPPHGPGTPSVLGRLPGEYPVTIEDVHADRVLIAILPADRSKAAREFALHHLELKPVRPGQAAGFEATLTNPVPRGEIQTSGTFGPWNGDDPGSTAVSGHYVFQNANLGTIKGLGGILSSTGSFDGPLNYLSVAGETYTPDFSLRTSHHPVALHTQFSAIVDGTNGNTILKDVVAQFEHSKLDVSGEVVDRTPKRGRTIELNAVSRGARVEDLLRLAVGSDEPVMTGRAQLQARIEIREGDTDLIDRMHLNGQFGLSDAQFTNPQTEEKLDALSLKGQGKPQESPVDNPASDLKGSFREDKGQVTFSRFTFGVEGAEVKLAGSYNLDSGDLDFRGKLRLQAKLSQTTTGVKSFFLKAVDPFLSGKNAGTVLPIKITGTKEKPTFALDFHDKLNHE